jgi:hypothetical protein
VQSPLDDRLKEIEKYLNLKIIERRYKNGKIQKNKGKKLSLG